MAMRHQNVAISAPLKWPFIVLAFLFIASLKLSPSHTRSKRFAEGFVASTMIATSFRYTHNSLLSHHKDNTRNRSTEVFATTPDERADESAEGNCWHKVQGFGKIAPAAAVVLASLLSVNVAVVHAETIKTFDMSLPSYDKISDAKSSIAGVEQKEAELMELKRAKELKEKSSSSGGGAGFSMPSFGGGGGGSTSSSSGGNFAIGSPSSADKERAKLEKLAARQAKLAAQKAADEERERKMKEKIEVVDFDMPTYDSSGAGSGKKSVFSL